jgi:uncharacterized protein (DUF433 family)
VDANRVIDEWILPDGFFTVEDGRHVLATACTLISFYFASAKHLTSEERLFAIREAGLRLQKFRAPTPASLFEQDWIVRDEFLTIDLAPFVKRTKERMDRLAAARDLVVADPNILGGSPIIRGTRIPVYDVAASVAAGVPTDRILAAYPSLDADKPTRNPMCRQRTAYDWFAANSSSAGFLRPSPPPASRFRLPSFQGAIVNPTFRGVPFGRRSPSKGVLFPRRITAQGSPRSQGPLSRLRRSRKSRLWYI